MLAKITGVVATGVDVEFVGDVAGSEDLVERRGAGLEAEIVLIATVKIDFQTGQISSTSERNWTIAVPVSLVRGNSENTTEHPRAGRIWRGAKKRGQLFD